VRDDGSAQPPRRERDAGVEHPEREGAEAEGNEQRHIGGLREVQQHEHRAADEHSARERHGLHASWGRLRPTAAAQHGVANRVQQQAAHEQFLGERRDASRLFRAADIHCQPNTAPEPFGLAFVEALYASLPVVTADMGGAREIVTPACGILVAPGDSDALTRALQHLVDDPAARATLGAGGPARARALCDPGPQLLALEAALA